MKTITYFTDEELKIVGENINLYSSYWLLNNIWLDKFTSSDITTLFQLTEKLYEAGIDTEKFFKTKSYFETRVNNSKEEIRKLEERINGHKHNIIQEEWLLKWLKKSGNLWEFFSNIMTNKHGLK